ncbi:MAG: ATP-dependent helicase IRC3 [Myxococcota bacterium]|jgi:ATP-dependent helicase IRC3
MPSWHDHRVFPIDAAFLSQDMCLAHIIRCWRTFFGVSYLSARKKVQAGLTIMRATIPSMIVQMLNGVWPNGLETHVLFGARPIVRYAVSTGAAWWCNEEAMSAANKSKLTLRPYQRAAIAAVIAARRRGVRRMVICLPTGAGKTVIFSELARLAKRQVLVLAHREELLAQAREKLEHALAEGGGEHRVVAIEQASLRAPKDAHIVVCSIRSLGPERLRRVLAGRDIGLVLYDECHHAVADDNQRVLSELGCFDDDWSGTLLGFTATTNRADGQGLDAVFEEVVYTQRISDLMSEGWLVPLRGLRVGTHADLSGLTGGGMDFREEELAEAIDIEERNALVARSIQELARDRRTVVFCVTVNHAKNLSKALNRLGVPSGVVHGTMKKDRRREELADFRAGRIVALCNVGVLTEGFDDPGVSAIAMARPTRSEGLYAQCVGRGTRLFEGKRDCLVLDFVDLSSLSLMSLPSLFGMPTNIDLEGAPANEAAAIWRQIELDLPTFEIEAGSITLAEIQERAAAFNPLTAVDIPDVRAISQLDWFSLGKSGLVLHVLKGSGVLTISVMKRATRGKKWHVEYDGKLMERFSELEQAVDAADYEVGRMGSNTFRSAYEHASWKRDAALPKDLSRLRKPPSRSLRRIDAFRLLAAQELLAPPKARKR